MGLSLPFSFWKKAEPIVVPRARLGFPELVRRSLSGNRAQWKSRLLSEAPISGSADAQEKIVRIINDVCDASTTVSKQVKRYLGFTGGIGSETFWAKYSESEDTLLAFSDSYRDLLVKVESTLPGKDATIFDVGAGTMNFSLFALMRAPTRRIVALDFCRRSLEQGRKKILLFSEGEDSPPTHRLLAYSLHDPKVDVRADAAMLVNVLYTQPDKEATLKAIASRMKWGAPLVIVDPAPRFRAGEKVKKFLLELATSAVQNNSPMSEFDLALVAYVYLRHLTRVATTGAPSFLPPADLIPLAQSCGFDVISNELVFSSSSRFMLMRKR